MGSITLSTAVTVLLAVAAGLVTLQKAWEIIRKIMHPEDDLRQTVAQNSNRIANNERRLEALEKSLLNEQEDSAEFRSVICRAMQAQFDHELSGNDYDRLRAGRDQLNSYLSNSRR